MAQRRVDVALVEGHDVATALPGQIAGLTHRLRSQLATFDVHVYGMNTLF